MTTTTPTDVASDKLGWCAFDVGGLVPLLSVWPLCHPQMLLASIHSYGCYTHHTSAKVPSHLIRLGPLPARETTGWHDGRPLLDKYQPTTVQQHLTKPTSRYHQERAAGLSTKECCRKSCELIEMFWISLPRRCHDYQHGIIVPQRYQRRQICSGCCFVNMRQST